MSTDAAAAIGYLINKGEFQDAVDVGLLHEKDAAGQSPDFWFQYAVARVRAGLDGREQYWRALAHPDCGELMKADVYRDIAGIAGRLGDFEAAARFIETSYRLSEDDSNRAASIFMMAARIHSLSGNHARAIELHGDAHSFWQMAGGDADRQWVMNNRFYWLRAKALLELPRRNLYQEFVRSSEPRADRRRQAALFFWTGPLAAGTSLAAEIAANHTYRRKIAGDDPVKTIIIVHDGLAGTMPD